MAKSIFLLRSFVVADYLGWHLPTKGTAIFFRFHWSFIWLVQGLVAVTLVPSWTRRQYIQHQKRMQLLQQAEHNSAELAALKAQINPHFLFNALNTLYSTALQERSEKTAEGIQKLGDMMRFMLHDNERDTIELSRELAYLHDYVALQKLRIGEAANVSIQLELPPQPCPQTLAPMLLMPFVENAFKHGISLRHPTWIHIAVRCEKNTIGLTVRNSVHLKTADDPEREASGIGLDNVQKRLQLLYPDRHQLSIQQTTTEFSIALEIQCSKHTYTVH